MNFINEYDMGGLFKIEGNLQNADKVIALNYMAEIGMPPSTLNLVHRLAAELVKRLA